MTRIKVLLIIILYATACLGCSLGIANCSGKRVSKAQQEVNQLKAEIITLEARITGLEERVDRSVSALEYAFLGAIQALEDDKDRISKIKADDGASDWLKCALPDCVRDAFAPTGSIQRSDSTETTAQAL